MFKFRKKIFLIAILFLLAMPFASSQAFDPIVPCATDATSQRACTLCDFIVGIKGIIDFGMSLIAIAAIAGITIAGVMYVVSAGDQKMMESAKSFLGACLKGFALFFLAWLMVTITMWVLGAKKAENEGGVLGINITGWNTFTCDSTSTQGQGNNNNNNTNVIGENCCVVNRKNKQCSHAKDISQCPVGEYVTGACSAISDCQN